MGRFAITVVLLLLGGCSANEDHLASKDPFERKEGIRALATSRDATAAVTRLAYVARHDTDAGVRAEATMALAGFGSAATLSLVEIAHRDDHVFVRGAALRILVQLRDPAAVPGLIAIWRDKPDAVGQAATSDALVATGSRAIPALLEVAIGSDPFEIRYLAFAALKQIGASDPRVRSTIAPLRADKDPSIRQLAEDLLGQPQMRGSGTRER
jgi:HEAT repeat protein